MTDSKLVTGRRNFLVRALGFTAAGAAVSVPIVTVASAEERLTHHLSGAKAALAEMFPTGIVNVAGNCLDGRHVEAHLESFRNGERWPAHVGLTVWPDKPEVRRWANGSTIL